MRIGIIGHFGGTKQFMDGQTVKTVTLYESLMEHQINGGRIDKIDTYYIKKNPLRFIWALGRCMLRDQKLIVLLSNNGRRVLFPALYWLTKLFHKEVYHDAIGGQLAREVEQNPKYQKYVSAFSGNWVESTALVNELQKLGVTNAIYLPNFKRIHICKDSELDMVAEPPYRFCTFSRVMEEKGITDAIHAVHELNCRSGHQIAVLDIYGPVESGYEEKLRHELDRAEGSCRYCGVIPANESVETLKRYFALLFPTYWPGEGMPGTIIDALSAGVPIIARCWAYCDEMLKDHETGYVYDFNQPERLLDCLNYAVENKEQTMQMKPVCLRAAERYSEETVLAEICKEMNLG